MILKTLKKDEVQLFYDLLTIHIISSSSAGRIKKLNVPHTAPGSMFATACCRVVMNRGRFEPQGWPSHNFFLEVVANWLMRNPPCCLRGGRSRPDLLLHFRFTLGCRWNRGGSETLAWPPLHQSLVDTDACNSFECPLARVSVRD